MRKNLFIILLGTAVIGAVGVGAWAETKKEPQAKEKVKKVIHSTPPLEYVGLENPLTKADPKTLPAKDPNIVAGKALYEANCAPCHGTKTDGKGKEAKGFAAPIKPVNFKDPEAISALDQGYLFWRIKEGGPGDPFYTAMPAWGEDFSDKEIWQIILYVYRAAGVSPKQKK